MRERNEMILADLIQIRAEQRPELDVLTFEHLSLDGGATPDEVRSYADLHTNGNRIAAALVDKGVERGDRIGLMMRNHPEFVETTIACSTDSRWASAAVLIAWGSPASKASAIAPCAAQALVTMRRTSGRFCASPRSASNSSDRNR